MVSVNSVHGHVVLLFRVMKQNVMVNGILGGKPTWYMVTWKMRDIMTKGQGSITPFKCTQSVFYFMTFSNIVIGQGSILKNITNPNCYISCLIPKAHTHLNMQNYFSRTSQTTIITQKSKYKAFSEPPRLCNVDQHIDVFKNFVFWMAIETSSTKMAKTKSIY